jgi:hypothetical protein
VGKTTKVRLLKAAEHSPELSGKIALEIQVGKRFEGDSLTTSEVKSITIPPIVFIHLLLAHHVTTGQTTWKNTKQSIVYQIRREKARR